MRVSSDRIEEPKTLSRAYLSPQKRHRIAEYYSENLKICQGHSRTCQRACKVLNGTQNTQTRRRLTLMKDCVPAQVSVQSAFVCVLDDFAQAVRTENPATDTKPHLTSDHTPTIPAGGQATT